MKKWIIAICCLFALLALVCFAILNYPPLYFWILYGRQSAVNGTRFSTLTKKLPNAPHIEDFKRLFPRSSLSYSFFSGSGEPGIDVETVVEGRYYLTMQMPVTFTKDDKAIQRWGDPKFYLNEITEIKSENGELRELSYGTNFRFGPSEWQKIVNSGGNFYFGGINLRKNDPLEGIDAVYRSIENKMAISNASITSEWKPKPVNSVD